MKNTLKMLAMRAKNRMMNRGNNMLQPKIKIIENDESEFLEKVRLILSDENNNLSPIGALMDEKKVLKLDARGKERYLLEITEKYLKAKELIEREERKSLA